MNELVLDHQTHQVTEFGWLVPSRPSADKQRIGLPRATARSTIIRTNASAERSATGTSGDPMRWRSESALLDVGNANVGPRKPTDESLELQERMKLRQMLALTRAKALEQELGIDDPIQALVEFFSQMPADNVEFQDDTDDLFGM